ncbi:60S Ribosomal protein L13 [Pseudoloma neurophilia]|uniref:60S Ribosomal protein L13 n=1 Tax=Pseudoloma neurophilia TaxID=146866 RepID=A0A0R0M4T7_9MICR|nr:60S Ribosomal protein L13 [Pseudoloma neurophilia]
MKHNNALTSNHFNKNSMKYKMWFNQPAQKQKRKIIRDKKAKAQFPMPLQKLAPVIRQPTQRHNHKLRLGRGFTEEEIKGAGLEFKYALAIGIKFDKRRKDRNMETFDRNVNRIKEYVAGVKVYKNRKEAREDQATSFKGVIMPVKNEKPRTKFINVSEIESFVKSFSG